MVSEERGHPEPVPLSVRTAHVCPIVVIPCSCDHRALPVSHPSSPARPPPAAPGGGTEPRAAGAPEGQEPPGHRVSLPPSVFKNRANAPSLDPEPQLENRVAPCLILAGAYEVVLLHVAGLRGWRGRRAGRRGGGPEQHCTAGRGAASVNGCGLVFLSEPQARNPEQEYEVLG